MRLSNKSRGTATAVMLLAVFVIAGVVLVLASCAPVTPAISISIGEGNMVYAGVTVPLSAIVENLSIEGEVLFEVLQDGEFAFIDSQGNLVIREDSPTGAAFSVRVTVSGYTATRLFVVERTPVESITLMDIPSLNAGDTYQLESIILPVKARENPVTYEIVAGAEKVSVSNGVLTVSSAAGSSDDIRIVAVAGGKYSQQVSINVLTIHAESITLPAIGAIHAGESYALNYTVAPNNATHTSAELIISAGTQFAHIEGNRLYIEDTAEVGSVISVYAAIGTLHSNTITVTVVSKPVEGVFLVAKYYEENEVMLGDTRELEVAIAPFNATDKDWIITIVSGSEYIDYDSDTRTFTVIDAVIGEEIIFKASAGGVDSEELVFVIVKTPVTTVVLSVDGGTVSVAPGETRSVFALVYPVNATDKYVDIFVEEGEEFVELSEGVLTFSNAPEGTHVVLRAYADGVASSPLLFTIVPVPVSSVAISTTDKIIELKGGDVVVFAAAVLPANATYKQVTYSILSGAQYGSLTSNGVFSVSPEAMRGTVIVQAVSADGVESNTITIEILGTYYIYTPHSWADIDNKPNKFNGYNALWLDLRAMPLNADGATLIISADVRNLVIEGAYSGTTATCISNLKLYFLSNSSAYVTLRNFGVAITERFGGVVIDFSTQAVITLDIDGSCYIEAGTPYSPYAEGFTVDGEWTTASTNYIRMHGMDGYGGFDGGTAINALSITVVGSGSLTLKAGSGSSGTNGGRGADVPSGISAQMAGKGGRGGYGGNSGYAIFANSITINMTGTIFAYGGDAGKGGAGGAGGVGPSSAYNGADGANGADGQAFSPIYAYTGFVLIDGTLNNIYTGRVIDNAEKRADSYADFARKLEKQYNVDIHYGTDFWNPYAPTLLSWRNKYKMAQQNSPAEIMRLMHGLEGAFTMFPHNIFIELAIVNQEVNIYLVNTITNSSGGVVYGLTNNANTMWLATFDTRLRDTFYSTYYNIMVHEMLHLLTFSMGSTSSNPMKTGLPSYNLGHSYVTNASGVYDPQNGYNADNSAFLTRYSKTDFNEDISDNLSLICMLVYKADYLDTGKAINLKCKYIANTYRNYYRSYAYYIPASWERFIWEY